MLRACVWERGRGGFGFIVFWTPASILTQFRIAPKRALADATRNAAWYATSDKTETATGGVPGRTTVRCETRSIARRQCAVLDLTHLMPVPAPHAHLPSCPRSRSRMRSSGLRSGCCDNSVPAWREVRAAPRRGGL